MINNFRELSLARHSVRKFSLEPIPDDLIHRLLEVVRTAPSAGNLQAYQIYVIKDVQVRKNLAAVALGQTFIASAPVVLVFMAQPQTSAERYGDRGVSLYAIQDATIACTYAILAATALGLSSTWVGAFKENEIQQVLGSGVDELPVALLPLGFGVEKPHATPRKPLIEMIREL